MPERPMPDRRDPPLSRPGAWAGLWRRMGTKGDLARQACPLPAA